MQIDLIDSVKSCAACDEVSGYTLLRSHLEPMCNAMVEYDGELIKLLGDGMQIAFVDPADALCCALELEQAVPVEATHAELKSRIALTYGDCLRYSLHDHVDYYAHEILLAARLATYGQDAGIVMSQAFRWHPRIRSLLDPSSFEPERVRLKGFPEEVTVYHLHADREAALRTA